MLVTTPSMIRVLYMLFFSVIYVEMYICSYIRLYVLSIFDVFCHLGPAIWDLSQLT